MIMRTIAILAVIAGSLGCASQPAPAPGGAGASADVDAGLANGLPFENFSLGAIEDAKLPEKSCGMILWSLDAQRPTPVFRYISTKKAEIMISGRMLELEPVEFAGSGSYGVFEQQSFSSPGGISVETESRFGLGFDGGSYLERALIKVRAPDGWSIVAPAAGIAGCRP